MQNKSLPAVAMHLTLDRRERVRANFDALIDAAAKERDPIASMRSLMVTHTFLNLISRSIESLPSPSPSIGDRGLASTSDHTQI